jgi:hypothetical protein
MGGLSVAAFAVWAAFSSWSAVPSLQNLPVCEPAPKDTLVVPCGAGEGCDEKWIFVPKHQPDLVGVPVS